MQEIYKGSMKTPMGTIQGKVMFRTNQNKFDGYIEVNGKRNYFTNGKIENNIYYFSGNIPYLLGKIEYNAKAKLENKKLEAIANTNLGNFRIYGEKLNN